MSIDVQRTLRADRQTVRSWLDRLDRRTAAVSLDGRQHARFRYRPDDLTIELRQGEDPSKRQRVAARNLSRQGAALVAGQFIYPSTLCHLTLMSPYGGQESVPGRVVRCRYIVGSGSLYELGVEFERPVDVSVFAPHGRLMRVLLMDGNLQTHELVRRFLAGLHVELAAEADAEAALQALAGELFDLALIDLEAEEFDAFATVRRMRSAGYIGPVVGMAVRTGAELHARCMAAGLTGYIPRPLIREELHNLVAALRDPPLVSTLAAEPDMGPLIDQFVAGLRDRVTALSLACATGEWTAVTRIVRGLQAEAGSYGFAEITEEAAYVDALLTAERTEDSSESAGVGGRIEPAVQQLMHVCLRARPVGRSSASTAANSAPEMWMRLVNRLPPERTSPEAQPAPTI